MTAIISLLVLVTIPVLLAAIPLVMVWAVVSWARRVLAQRPAIYKYKVYVWKKMDKGFVWDGCLRGKEDAEATVDLNYIIDGIPKTCQYIEPVAVLL